MNRKTIIFLILALLFVVSGVFSQVPKPEDVVGFKIGTDRKVADMFQIIDYFHRLDAASNRVIVKEVGKTTKGNPFIVAIITSERNHKDLEKYREYQQLLADPRKISEKDAQKIIAESKAVVMINCSIHASEIGAAQMSMELGYDLATDNDPSTQRILDNVILLLVPMHNPDGIQIVVEWYKKNLGTQYEGGRMPWLYHKYVGHDNNRDWYMFTQVESRLTLKVHNAWHPHIIVDMHQMGSTGPRLFVPPYVDPFEPNVDPILQQQVAMMGTFMATELTAQGKAGVAHSTRYDAWTPARAYHMHFLSRRNKETCLNRLMKKGHTIRWNAEPFMDARKSYPVGTMVALQKEGLVDDLESIVKDLHVQFEALQIKPGVKAYRLKPVRLGLYKSWTASMDEGWTRWVLEQYEFPYISVFDKDIREGRLETKFDVLLFPDFSNAEVIVEGLSEKDAPSEYAGGIGEVGVKNIKSFVQKGGTLITLNSAAQFCIQHLHLGIQNSVAGKDRKDFYIPGSILKVLNNTNHPISYGFQRDAAIFFRWSPVFVVNEGVSVAKYPALPFLSGWINGEDFLVDKSAIVDVSYEKGKVILLGFPVLYRGQSHGSFKYLFNAIYYGASVLGEF